MDYRTKPISRKILRDLATVFRNIFNVTDLSKPFPVLEILEKVPDVFKGTTIEIVDDSELPKNWKAACTIEDGDSFTIKIKESVYNSAYTKKDGASLGFILHEICHVFLFLMGFKPILARSFSNNIIPAYCSVEWQAKALCGEVMMPYEETKDLTEEEICRNYNVSTGFAGKRKKY